MVNIFVLLETIQAGTYWCGHKMPCSERSYCNNPIPSPLRMKALAVLLVCEGGPTLTCKKKKRNLYIKKNLYK